MDHPEPKLVPAAAEQMRWIETVCERGVRRPGSEADRWATDWIAERFRAMGLEDVRLEEVALPRWEPSGWSLRVWNEKDSLDVPCFPLPHSAPARSRPRSRRTIRAARSP